jgi:hypothetical protein
MILISMIQNPPESAKEMVKRSMQMPRLPEFIKTRGPYIASVVGEGIKTLTIYDFEDSKYGEAMKHIGKSLGAFHGVPGFTYSIGVWLRAKDAYEAFGVI